MSRVQAAYQNQRFKMDVKKEITYKDVKDEADNTDDFKRKAEILLEGLRANKR